MSRPIQLFFISFLILLSSCNNDHIPPYAIKDFRKVLQPSLLKIVDKGIVRYYDTLIRTMATDKEIIQLSQSEHPVLRATAFREMLSRKSINHFEILMNNLDDTALIYADEGEFGIAQRTISDDILHRGKWQTQEAKNKTIDKVLKRYNYLSSAYNVLYKLDPKEKYYYVIKNMATRPLRTDPDGFEYGFMDMEYALYGLAKFKKKGRHRNH